MKHLLIDEYKCTQMQFWLKASRCHSSKCIKYFAAAFSLHHEASVSPSLRRMFEQYCWCFSPVSHSFSKARQTPMLTTLFLWFNITCNGTGVVLFLAATATKTKEHHPLCCVAFLYTVVFLTVYILLPERRLWVLHVSPAKRWSKKGSRSGRLCTPTNTNVYESISQSWTTQLGASRLLKRVRRRILWWKKCWFLKSQTIELQINRTKQETETGIRTIQQGSQLWKWKRKPATKWRSYLLLFFQSMLHLSNDVGLNKTSDYMWTIDDITSNAAQIIPQIFSSQKHQ